MSVRWTSGILAIVAGVVFVLFAFASDESSDARRTYA
jgi:hypothetical protein